MTITDINNKLKAIENAIIWVDTAKKMKGEKSAKVHKKLVEQWRILRRKKNALEGNPAAAMFGESQAGKSYLVTSLLSDPEKPYGIKDFRGEFYNFKADINPRGNDMESTSLVTRFSTKYISTYDQYPIIAKMLTPMDIVLVICEAYYHNLNVNEPLKYEQLKAIVADIESQYQDKEKKYNYILEADIYDINEYFESNFSKLVYNNLSDVHFFDIVAKLIDRIPPTEWKDVLSVLWNKNEKLTKLFGDLISQYNKLGFSDTVYLPIESVLRIYGTLLDVSRLDEIYRTQVESDKDYKRTTSVLLPNQNSVDFDKPFLCALISELIFVLPKEIEENKPFLKETDILDLPGTRRFETINENNITEESLSVLLRRGKVDYLFNKYSRDERINVLLFCQNHKQSNQSVMPAKLDNWIGLMVGKTPEERESFLSKIPPIFVISTWFNCDLQFNPVEDKPDRRKSLDDRWEQRFKKTLEKEIFKTDTYTWFNNWTKSNPNFQNIFPLRDFEKSESLSQLFTGYNEKGVECEEIKPASYPEFRKDLRQSFIEYDFVKKHFADPAESWDRATSINEDGTHPIIEKLTAVAKDINPARHEKTQKAAREILDEVIATLENEHESESKDAQLRKNIKIAGNLQGDMDIAFRDEHFFGKMMKQLLLNGGTVHNIFVDLLQSIERRDIIQIDEYEAIRMQVPELSADNDEDTNIEFLRRHYEKSTKEETIKFFEDRNINLHELFYGKSERVKNFSQVLSEKLWDYWLNTYIPSHKSELEKIFPNGDLQELLKMMEQLFNKLEVAKKIAQKIRRHVDIHRDMEKVYDMVADISTEMFNKFINTVGLEYYGECEYDDLEKASANIQGLIINHEEFNYKEQTHEGVAKLITMYGNRDELRNKPTIPMELKRLPYYCNYLRWYDALKAGFVTAAGVPIYDPAENEELGRIIDEVKA